MRFVKKIMGMNDGENDINKPNEEIEDYESSSDDKGNDECNEINDIEMIHGKGEKYNKCESKTNDSNIEEENSGSEENSAEINNEKDDNSSEKNEDKEEKIEDIIYEEIGYERKSDDWEEIGVFTLDEGIYGCTFILSSTFAVETDRCFARMFFETPNYEKTPKVKTIFDNKDIHYDRPTETFFKLVLLKKSTFAVQLKIAREMKHRTDPFNGGLTIYLCPI